MATSVLTTSNPHRSSRADWLFSNITSQLMHRMTTPLSSLPRKRRTAFISTKTSQGKLPNLLETVVFRVTLSAPSQTLSLMEYLQLLTSKLHLRAYLIEYKIKLCISLRMANACSMILFAFSMLLFRLLACKTYVWILKWPFTRMRKTNQSFSMLLILRIIASNA
jgi:hypothetical protein